MTRINLDIRKLLIVLQRFRIVAPEPGLRLEVQAGEQRASALQIRFFDEDIRRQPHAGLQIQAPAIKVQVVAVAGMRRIGPVEADDVVVAVFHPDPAQEASAVHRPWVERRARCSALLREIPAARI